MTESDKPQILLVVDMPFLRSVLIEYLSEYGYTGCVVLSSAQQAHRQLAASQTPPALTILDNRLRGSDVCEVVQQMRGRFPAMPIVILASDPYDAACLRTGCTVLAKDADVFQRLLAVLATTVGSPPDRPGRTGASLVEFRLINTLQNIEHIGTSPALWQGLFSEADDWSVDVRRVAERLSREPTVLAQVLKIANSPVYFRGASVATPAVAVMQLGLITIKRVVLAVQLLGLYHGRSDTTGFADSRFWKHTLAGAMLTQEIARRNRSTLHEHSYVAALLRNIGVLVFRQFFPDLFVQIVPLAASRRLSFRAAEARVCRMDHRDISAYVARRWGLPDEVVAPLDERTPGVGEETRRYLRVADTILYQRAYERWDEFDADLCDESEMLVHGVDAASAEALCATVLPQVEEIASHVSW